MVKKFSCLANNIDIQYFQLIEGGNGSEREWMVIRKIRLDDAQFDEVRAATQGA
jgi:hypothetical protein